MEYATSGKWVALITVLDLLETFLFALGCDFFAVFFADAFFDTLFNAIFTVGVAVFLAAFFNSAPLVRDSLLSDACRIQNSDGERACSFVMIREPNILESRFGTNSAIRRRPINPNPVLIVSK